MGETLNVLFYAQGDGTYELRVKESWSGQTVSGPFIPPYTTRQLNALQKKLGSFNSQDAELRELGKRLYAALCGTGIPNGLDDAPADPALQEIFRNVIQRTLRRRGTVALMLEFGPGCDEFMRYPWELLHNGDHFLLVSGVFTLSRVLLRPERPIGCELPVHPPFRVLYIAASPADCVPLETERSFDAMQQALSPLIDAGQIFLDRLEPPTFSQLVRYLSLYGGAGMLDDSDTALPCYVIHFDGHGAYGRLCPKDGCEVVNAPDARKCRDCGTSLRRIVPQTYLCFCDDEGMNRFIDTQSLRDLLLSSDIRLAVFSACETATLSDEPSASQAAGHSTVDTTLATALVTAQIPAVVAMPFSLQDDLSPTFMLHFYEALAEGRTLEEGLARARQAMLPMQQRSWFIPVLYRHVAEEDEEPVPLLEIGDASGHDHHPLAYLAPASNFVGRARELQVLDELLTAAATGKQRPDVSGRLRIGGNHYTHHFALIGPAGIGKSALACEAVRRNRNKFPGGIIGVSLQQGKSFAEAMSEIGRRLRLHMPQRNSPPDVVRQTRLVQGTLRSLANRELPCLLLLDSFEEVKERAELDQWLQFLSRLPQEVVVLVTSHANPSNLAIVNGSHCRWYEQRLEKMAPDDLLTLFGVLAEESGLDHRIHLDDSAQQAILHEICALLDGYPLGAELIFGAARAIGGKIYTPEAATRSLEEVRDDLRDTPLAGMLAALEISYRRLSPSARLLLAYLAAFRLPFNREQINLLVTSAPQDRGLERIGEEELVLTSLAGNWRGARDELVQASFIQFDGHTYLIHTQVRNFALAYLPIRERGRVHRIIAGYYADLPSPTAEEWFAAFEHLEAAGESDDLLNASRLAVRAAQALRGRGPLQDVLVMLRRAALHASHLKDRSAEGQIQCCLGTILRQTGQYAEAEAYLRSALASQRQDDERDGMGWTFYELARLFSERGDFPQAWDYASEACELFQKTHNASGEAWARVMLGDTCRGQDRYAEALNYFSSALEAFQVLDDRKGRAATLHCRGLVSVMLGRYAQALHDYDEALQLYASLGLPLGRAWVLANKGAAYIELLQYPESGVKKKDSSLSSAPTAQAGVAYAMNPNMSVDAALGKLEQAEAACRAAQTLFQDQGQRRGQAWTLRLLGDSLRLRRDVVHAREYYEKAYTLLNANGSQSDLARVLISLGGLLFEQGEYLEAKGLYEQASVITYERGARRSYAQALRGLGDVARVLRQYGDAERYYRDALAIATELGASSERSVLLLRQGMLCEEQKQYHEALDFWVQALILDPQLRYPPYSNLQQRVNVLVSEQHLEEAYSALRARHSLV
jgi:tetratricopeptide (TPR) repeat protein